MREEIARLMSLQTIDRQLHELGQSLSSVAERVEQLRGEIETSQAELDRLTEEDQQAATARRHLERELADGEAQIRNKRMRLNLVRNEGTKKDSLRVKRRARGRAVDRDGSAGARARTRLRRGSCAAPPAARDGDDAAGRGQRGHR